MKAKQRDMFKCDDRSPEVWRQAAQTALSNPYFTEAERKWRADYYTREAEKLERGEA